MDMYVSLTNSYRKPLIKSGYVILQKHRQIFSCYHTQTLYTYQDVLEI